MPANEVITVVPNEDEMYRNSTHPQSHSPPYLSAKTARWPSDLSDMWLSTRQQR
jgi:hypothetical protein